MGHIRLSMLRRITCNHGCRRNAEFVLQGRSTIHSKYFEACIEECCILPSFGNKRESGELGVLICFGQHFLDSWIVLIQPIFVENPNFVRSLYTTYFSSSVNHCTLIYYVSLIYYIMPLYVLLLFILSGFYSSLCVFYM